MVKNEGPEAFQQQQSRSEQGSDRKKDPKVPNKPPPVWDPFSVLFGTDFENFSGTPFFRVFVKTGPQNGAKMGSLFEALDLAQV